MVLSPHHSKSLAFNYILSKYGIRDRFDIVIQRSETFVLKKVYVGSTPRISLKMQHCTKTELKSQNWQALHWRRNLQ